MSAAIDFIQYGERMVGEASPDYSDTLNRALKTVVSLSAGDENAFGGFALRPDVDATPNQFYRATGTGAAATWVTLVTAMISDLTTAATGITKVGTVNTGVWQGTSIATTYTDAKVKTVTGTANRLTVGGTATDPTFDISAAYVGQASITTLGTIATGVWQGTSIGTAYTDAKVVSISGVSNRTTISGTATVPIVDISATYVGQGSITTVGTIASGVWQGTSIATGFTDAKIKTVTGTLGTVTISGTATDPIFTISAAYIGQNTITTLGTITTGVWNGTAISTTFTSAQVIDVTGTASRITIGGTATHPTVDIAAAYIGQSSITTLGTVTTGTWQGTSIATGFTDAKVKTVTGTTNRLTIGGTATDPTFDISVAYVGQSTITTLGTIATGTWAGTTISVDHGGTGLTSYAVGDILFASGATTLTKLVIGSAAQILVTNGAATAPAWHTLVTADITDLTSASTGITKVGTVTTGIWNAGVIPGTYGGTGVNNGTNTITLGGNFTTSGAFTTTLTVTANTNVTLPTSGTLINSAVTSLASLTSVGGAFAISGAFTGATSGAFSATVTAAQLTISTAVGHIVPGATSISLRNNSDSADNLIITDAGVATIRAGLTVTAGGLVVSAGGLTVSASGVTVTGNSTIAGTLGSLTGITSTGTAGFATVTFSTTASSTTAAATPAAYIATTATVFASTASGGVLMGYGTTGDVTLKNRAGNDVLYIGPNNTQVTTTGALAIAGALTGATTGAFSGAVTTGTINGQTVSAAANFTGSMTIAGTITNTGGANTFGAAGAVTSEHRFRVFTDQVFSVTTSGGTQIRAVTDSSAYAPLLINSSTLTLQIAANAALSIDANKAITFAAAAAGPSLTFTTGSNFGSPTAKSTAAGLETTIDLFEATGQSFRIGMSGGAQGWISIAGASTGGFAIYTMNDNSTVPTKALDIGNTGNMAVSKGSFTVSGAAFIVTNGGGIQLANPTGGDKGNGTINIAGDIYKNNTAYTNPDYVFELAYTGSVTKFAENAGAAKFVERGIMSLDQIEDFARKTWQLPGVAEAEGIFERADVVLEKIEEAYLHLFDLHKRLKKIEAAAV